MKRNAFLACFCNMGGDLSFTKLVVIVLLVMHGFKLAPSILSETLLMAAAFGKSTFEGWLQKSSFSASENNTTIETIERRVIDNGIATEPAP